jgi:hypothetical protein
MHELQFIDRPSLKAENERVGYTEEQRAAQSNLGKHIATLLTAETLHAIGAFVTPGSKGLAGGLQVAFSVPLPALTFTNPDNETETTREWFFNANAPIPKKSRVEAKPTERKLAALSYSDWKAQQARK